MSSIRITITSIALAMGVQGAELFVETEALESRGGWKLDTQFIDEMGSPYLLAHGLGSPVADATGSVTFPSPGDYRVFVRTKDWTARWGAKESPGQFQIKVGSTLLPTRFGTTGKEWGWQDGGRVNIKEPKTQLALHDLTGFDGRCDAIYFTTGDGAPPAKSEALATWRRKQLGLPDKVQPTGPYDLVVVGGGYSGMGAAISAARAGCKVALIQNRPVLGGNGSSEVRVWAKGNIRRGKYPRIGEIIDEISDRAQQSPGTYEEFGDAKKEAIVRAEKNIDLFLNHHARAVEMADGKIVSVTAFDTRSGGERRFSGALFADCTGHGTIGHLAGADYDMTPKGRMGMSNMWRWDEGAKVVDFPETPWALDLEMADFPYPRDHHGQWFWESGYDKDPLSDAEGIRDHNLRAVYGAFNAMKNRGGAEKHKNAALTWVAYIGGPRESRRLLGDVLLTEKDIVSKRDFADGCVPSTWSIDLHYPKKQYSVKFPDNPFISIAVHGKGVDRKVGYPVPYRCFYSRNIPNLFMAGRCISVTHEALGTVRVMKTCGMMGEVVGKAAAICTEHRCSPREVHGRYLDTLLEMLELPGKAYRQSVGGEFTIPADALPNAGPTGPKFLGVHPKGIDPKSLPGVVIDDRAAKKEGKWIPGTGLSGFYGGSYLYAAADSDSSATFEFVPKTNGRYEIRFAYLNHENRGTAVPVAVSNGERSSTTRIDMTKAAPIAGGWISLGTHTAEAGKPMRVSISSAGAGGNAHTDAVQFIPAK